MKSSLHNYRWWILGFLLFLIVSLTLYFPVFNGKQLMGSDTLQFRAMEHERVEYKKEHGHETYWTNAVFGGMPTYLLGADYPWNIPGKINRIWNILPKPVNFLLVYFIGFLLLGWILRLKPPVTLLGAIGFTLSTYLIIILQVGHFAKAGAIAYMPWVLAGVFLILLRKKYLWGFVLTTLAVALEINAKHYQMTYYLGLALLIFGIIYFIDAWKNKDLPKFLKETGLLLLAAVTGIGMNWTSMSAVKQYISQSTRGKQFLTIKPDGSPIAKKEGLSKSYITEYSYGIAETLDLFIPGFMGGSNREKLDESSALYKALKGKTDRHTAKQFVENTSLYWGDQPIVMAPAYIGAVILFLALLGFLLYEGRLKTWIAVTSVLVLLLSWGKNLEFFTDLFIDYFPYYNKFRVVASIQVVLELLLPLMAVLGLTAFFDPQIPKAKKEKALKIATYTLGGIALFFALLGPQLFHFTSPNDQMYERYGLLDALISDRQSLMRSDNFRSLILVLLSAGILWLWLKEKIRNDYAITGLILLVAFDLGGVAKRYIRKDDFVSERRIANLFVPTPVDQAIMKDTSYYRVINLARNPLTDGMTSYFHKNLGGYHAAKPRRIQDIFDFHLRDSLNPAVLNMYNVKYIIFKGKQGLQYSVNRDAYGNAWFVSSVKHVKDQNGEILSLRNTDLKNTAVVSGNDLKNFQPAKDSTATVKLISYAPNKLTYESRNGKNGLAVFSENYYPYGWKAFVDGKPAKIYRVDYALRALKIPAGKHRIVMSFQPDIIRKGTVITIIFFVVFLTGLFGAVYLTLKRKPLNKNR